MPCPATLRIFCCWPLCCWPHLARDSFDGDGIHLGALFARHHANQLQSCCRTYPGSSSRSLRATLIIGQVNFFVGTTGLGQLARIYQYVPIYFTCPFAPLNTYVQLPEDGSGPSCGLLRRFFHTRHQGGAYYRMSILPFAHRCCFIAVRPLYIHPMPSSRCLKVWSRSGLGECKLRRTGSHQAPAPLYETCRNKALVRLT